MSRSLDVLAADAAGCVRCPLSGSRTQVVFGAGNPNADVVVVGEAPGRDEDLQGVPFVGRAGQLLTRCLSEAGIDRDDVYIANVLKCRPPNNRDPLANEIEACRPWLADQIDAVDPLLVVTVGNFSTKLLLDTSVGISRLHGKTYRYDSRWLIPTYHPSAALRGGPEGSVLRQLREDLVFASATLDKLRSSRRSTPGEMADAERRMS